MNNYKIYIILGAFIAEKIVSPGVFNNEIDQSFLPRHRTIGLIVGLLLSSVLQPTVGIIVVCQHFWGVDRKWK